MGLEPCSQAWPHEVPKHSQDGTGHTSLCTTNFNTVQHAQVNAGFTQNKKRNKHDAMTSFSISQAEKQIVSWQGPRALQTDPMSLVECRIRCVQHRLRPQVDTSHIMHTGAGRHREEVPRQTDGVTKLPMVGVVQRGGRRQQRHLAQRDNRTR